MNRARIDAEKNQKSYSGLFNESPVPLWEEDFSKVKEYTDHWKARGVEDFEAFLQSIRKN